MTRLRVPAKSIGGWAGGLGGAGGGAYLGMRHAEKISPPIMAQLEGHPPDATTGKLVRDAHSWAKSVLRHSHEVRQVRSTRCGR